MALITTIDPAWRVHDWQLGTPYAAQYYNPYYKKPGKVYTIREDCCPCGVKRKVYTELRCKSVTTYIPYLNGDIPICTLRCSGID